MSTVSSNAKCNTELWQTQSNMISNNDNMMNQKQNKYNYSSSNSSATTNTNIDNNNLNGNMSNSV